MQDSTRTQLFAAALLVLQPWAAVADDYATRRDITERGLQYLFSVQKDGALGESRQKTVTALFILSCLSSGILPADEQYGTRVTAACEWLIDNSSADFFGGREQPHADHAVAALAITELIGTAADSDRNRKLYEQAAKALAYSLSIQSKGIDADYYGGWRPNVATRVNDRVLTGWFLLQLRSGRICGMKAPKSNVSRAVAFVEASQKRQTQKVDELGGFSVDAQGLPVLSATAAGMAVLAFFDPDDNGVTMARDWLIRHPPRWYGPNFFESHFFAVRGLYRARHPDRAKAFNQYFSRLLQLLKERQEPDGSVPFPPGHGGPLLAMGKSYSTAMAVLILNVDRGILPVDN